MFFPLEGKAWAQQTCRAKPCVAPRVSERAFIRRIRKQTCKVDRQQGKAWQAKLRESCSRGKPGAFFCRKTHQIATLRLFTVLAH